MPEISDEEIREICILRASKKSIIPIAKKKNLTVEQIETIISDNSYLVDFHENEIKIKKIKSYEDLSTKATKVLRDILTTSFIVPVYDGKGEKKGTKTDTTILKIQKEVASEVLESCKIKKTTKAGGINILNNTSSNSEGSSTDITKGKLIEGKAEKVKLLLDDCKLED